MFAIRRLAETPPEGNGDGETTGGEVLLLHYSCLLSSALYARITVRADDSLESSLLAAGFEVWQVRDEGSTHNLAPAAGAVAGVGAQGIAAHMCSECGGV